MNETTTQPTTAGTFTANRRTLAAALARLATTTPSRNRPTVLQAVRVSVNGSVELFATDTERWHTETITADDKAGELATLVNAAAFRQAVNACSADTVRVDVNAAGITVIDKQARRTVPAVASVDEQPNPAHFEPSTGYCRAVSGRWFGSAATLAELIGATAFAADVESSRYALSPLLVELQSGTVANGFCRLVATDGRRLSEAVTDNPEPDELATALWSSVHATKAAKALTDKAARFALLQIVTETPKPLPVPVQSASPSIATIGIPTPKPKTNAKAAEPVGTPFVQLFVFDVCKDILAAFTFRTVDGRFPRWRDVIPNSNGAPLVVTVGSRELATLAGSAVAAGTDVNRGVDFTFNADGLGWLIVTVIDGEAEAAANAAAELATFEARKQWQAAEPPNAPGPVREQWQAAKPSPIAPEPVPPAFVGGIPIGTREAGTAAITLDGRYVQQFAAGLGAPAVPVDIAFQNSESPALLSAYRSEYVRSIPRGGFRARYVVMPLSRDRK